MNIRSNGTLERRDIPTTFRGTTGTANGACGALLAAAIGLSWAGAASAGYIGESFLQVPHVSGLIGEVGPRPTAVPEYCEYRLKDVQLSCPVIAAAPEQAFVLGFNDIAWVNFQGDGRLKKLPVATPASPVVAASNQR